MRVPRLYCPELTGGVNVLPAEEFHHAVKVLRLRPGDPVVLFDGKGHEGAGGIEPPAGRELRVHVGTITTRPFETMHRITLGVAFAKAHRHAYLVEKCTELGVAAIWPILAERSVTEPGDAAVEKWSRRAVEAAKQSHRAWLPAFREPQPVPAVIARIPEFAAAALADPDGEESWSVFLATQPHGADILALVGPEGGFTDREREAIVAANARPVRLAPTILRTETAAVALCAAAAACSPSPLKGEGLG